MSPTDKDAVIAILDGVPKREDIICRSDIENLLERHPAVLKSHFKLWLASTHVLDRVMNNASMIQSDFDVLKVHRDVRRYVQNAAFPRAIEILEDNRAVIISGVPGVGKTTLARMLLYRHLETNFEIVSVLDRVEEARKRFNPEKRQIFYFDDFLGATFLGERAESLTRYEDKAILDFIEIVRASKYARMIMTTREHILNQALDHSERFKQSQIENDRCILQLSDYSHFQKAEILYNHIYFSDLPQGYIDVLLQDRFYKDIIESEKYSPRLIEWLSTFTRIKSIPAEEYRTFVAELLDNPAEIWAHAFSNQISESARSMLFALYSLGGRASVQGLSQKFESIHSARANFYNFGKSAADERRALREIDESFVSFRNDAQFIDPSVMDLLNTVIAATLYLHITPEESQKRMSGTKLDRMERSVAKKLDIMYRGYEELAKRFPHRIKRIDALRSEEAIQADIRSLVDNLYK